MKVKNLLLLVVVAFFVVMGCNSDDEVSGCNDTADCIPADFVFPGGLLLTISSLETGDDVFLNNLYAIGDFQIRDVNTNEALDFSLLGFADLNENGIVDEDDFIGVSGRITIILSFDVDSELMDFMYEVVLSETQSIPLNFSAFRVSNEEVEITDIFFGDTLFEMTDSNSYNLLLE